MPREESQENNLGGNLNRGKKTLDAFWGIKSKSSIPDSVSANENDRPVENSEISDTSSRSFMVTLKWDHLKQRRTGSVVDVASEIKEQNGHDLFRVGKRNGLTKLGGDSIGSRDPLNSNVVANGPPNGHSNGIAHRSVSTGPSFSRSADHTDMKVASVVSTSNTSTTTITKDPAYSFFTKASEKRSIVQPDVVQRIQQLETEKTAGTQSIDQEPDTPSAKPKRPVHPFFFKKAKVSSVEQDLTLGVNVPLDQPSKTRFLVNDPPARPHSAPLPLRSLDSSHLKSVNLPVPLPTCHCRGTLPTISCPPLRLEKRKSKRKDIVIDESESVLQLRKMPKYNPIIRKPKRVLLLPDNIKELAASIHPKNTRQLTYLIDSCPLPKAFDVLDCDQNSWCMKYSPPTSSSVITGEGNAKNVETWLEKKIDRLKQFKLDLNKQKKRKKPLDDFIVDESEDMLDDDVDRLSKFLILYGPPGAGKTSSVYAAGKELGAYIFEINPGQRRGAKELLSILEGIGQSHLVHSGDIKKNESIVLIEEVDVLFEDDSSFWNGLERFATTSKRPIVLTCTSPALLPSQITEEDAASFLQFTHAGKEIMTDALYLIALNEGHILEKQALEIFIDQHNYDLRSCITNLQFWCQMGIGGRKSGVDWFLTSDEARGSKRVFSEGTFIGVTTDAFDTENRDVVPDLDLGMLSSKTDTNSFANILQCQTKTVFRESCFAIGDQILGLPATSEVTFDRHPLAHELIIYDEITKRNNYDSIEPSISKSVDPTVLREAFSVLSFRQSFAATAPCYNSIECTGDAVLSTEIAPYIREMARYDLELVRSEDMLRQSVGDGLRVTRRSFKALGGSGARRYLDGDPEEMLNTGSDRWVVDTDVDIEP